MNRLNKIKKYWALILLVILAVAFTAAYQIGFRLQGQTDYAIESWEFGDVINDATRLLMAQEVCGNETLTDSLSEQEKVEALRKAITVTDINGSSEAVEEGKDYMLAYYNKAREAFEEMPELQYCAINEETGKILSSDAGLSVLADSGYKDTEYANYEFLLVLRIEDGNFSIEQIKGASHWNFDNAMADNYNRYITNVDVDELIGSNDYVTEEAFENDLKNEFFAYWITTGNHTFIYGIQDISSAGDSLQTYIRVESERDSYVEDTGLTFFITCLAVFVLYLLLGVRKKRMPYEKTKYSIPWEIKWAALIAGAIYLPLLAGYEFLPTTNRKYYLGDYFDFIHVPWIGKELIAFMSVLASYFVFAAIAREVLLVIKRKGYLKATSLFLRIIPKKIKKRRKKEKEIRSIKETFKRRWTIFLMLTVAMIVAILWANVWLSDISYYEDIFYPGCIVYGVIFGIYAAVMGRWIHRIYKECCMIEEKAQDMARGELGNHESMALVENAMTKNYLDQIEDGLNLAIEAAVKSQMMKTELITNVSHDLKTPLTSIVSYVDILKDKGLSEEERDEYLDILDKKSARLKVLIEDLFEMSKAASKDLKLSFVDLNVVSLTQEVLIEYEKEFDKKNLKLNISYCSETMKVNLDGDKTYRIISNLISNIVKYTMPGTRVYVVITTDYENAILEFKNTSANEITHQGKDLMERFVREDKSRNTEGSGLGLAIAKSLTELQHGTMEVDVDGDLFKVRLSFPLV